MNNQILVSFAKIAPKLPPNHKQLILSLSPTEQDYYRNRKLNDRLKRQFLSGRLLLKKLLKSKFGRQADSFDVDLGENFRPQIKAGDLSLDISIAHSGDLVACALSDNRVGIDIEMFVYSTKRLNVAKRYFSTDEVKAINRFENDEQKLIEFYRRWTLKEAWLKLHGKSVVFIGQTPIFRPTNERHQATSVENLDLKFAENRYLCSIVADQKSTISLVEIADQIEICSRQIYSFI